MSPPAVVQTLASESILPPKEVAGKPVADKLSVLRTNLAAPGPKSFADPYEEREYLKKKLTVAFRIFAKYGFDEGVAGHITLRDPVQKDTFWVNPFGIHFALIKPSDLLQVDHKGEIVGGGPHRMLNQAAFAIHSAIHAARPDVMCAAHSHTIHGRTFCAMGKTLEPITQDSCAFYDDHVLYDNFQGVVVAEEEGKAIAKCLGNKKAALLQNHGILTVASTVEAAVFWFVSLDKCCYSQLLADAAGTPKKIDHDDAVNTHRTVGSSIGGWFSGKPLFDLMERDVAKELE